MLTILLCTERIFLVRLKVRGGGAPELPIAAPSGGAGVVGLPLVNKWKHAGLTARVAAIHWSRSICVTTGKGDTAVTKNSPHDVISPIMQLHERIQLLRTLMPPPRDPE